jgi:hypothetical protein
MFLSQFSSLVEQENGHGSQAGADAICRGILVLP